MENPFEIQHSIHDDANEKMRTHKRWCTLCSDCVAVVFIHVKNTCGMYTPARTDAQDTCLVHITHTAKMHIHPRKQARVTVQQPL